MFGRCFMFQLFQERARLRVLRLGRKDTGGFRCGGVEFRRSPAIGGGACGERHGGHLMLAAAALLLVACGRSTPALEHTEAAALLSNARASVTDGRGRFREIYCAVRRDHGAALPYDRPCEDSAALWRLPGEPPPIGRPVTVGRVAPGTRVVMVPGLLAECVADLSKVFADATANLEAQGYATGYIQTRGRRRQRRQRGYHPRRDHGAAGGRSPAPR